MIHKKEPPTKEMIKQFLLTIFYTFTLVAMVTISIKIFFGLVDALALFIAFIVAIFIILTC
jgi:hypothetical protein